MISIDEVICGKCRNYNGIAWAGKEEASEYIKCAVAKNGNAEELLEWHDLESDCEEFEEDDNGNDKVGNYKKR